MAGCRSASAWPEIMSVGQGRYGGIALLESDRNAIRRLRGGERLAIYGRNPTLKQPKSGILASWRGAGQGRRSSSRPGRAGRPLREALPGARDGKMSYRALARLAPIREAIGITVAFPRSCESAGVIGSENGYCAGITRKSAKLKIGAPRRCLRQPARLVPGSRPNAASNTRAAPG